VKTEGDFQLSEIKIKNESSEENCKFKIKLDSKTIKSEYHEEHSLTNQNDSEMQNLRTDLISKLSSRRNMNSIQGLSSNPEEIVPMHSHVTRIQKVRSQLVSLLSSMKNTRQEINYTNECEVCPQNVPSSSSIVDYNYETQQSHGDNNTEIGTYIPAGKQIF
jgi:hypothetical protein